MYYLKFGFYIFATCVSIVSAQSTNITIPLNKILTYWDKELYGDFIHINGSSTVQVNFDDVNSNVSFIILQVHSHLYKVTLYKKVLIKGSYVTGTNIGMYSSAKNGLETFYIENPNENALKLFVSVHGYGSKDPIPGGCNMEFPVPISPFLLVTLFNKTYINVDAAPPQVDVKCLDVLNICTDFYMMYLPEHNFDSEPYFEAIRMMSNYKTLSRGNVRFMDRTKWLNRRMVSAYPGTGAVYVAIAKRCDGISYPSPYSMYVPSHSYACDPLVENDCDLLKDSFSMLVCALLLFVGAFICYFGHRFFKTQIVILGCLIGLVVTYIFLSSFTNLDHPAVLAASALSGMCAGASLWVIWWRFGLPILVIAPFCFQIGFLIACIFYYVAPAPWVYYIMYEEVNFWSIFFSIMILVTIGLISVSQIVNILCCTIVGGYVTIYSLDYYLGSNMKYILNNVVRRVSYAEFKKVIIVPTFQFNDWILTFVWIILIITGFVYQYHQNKGKPPFPPPPASVRLLPEEPVSVPERLPRMSGLPNANERTPLLA